MEVSDLKAGETRWVCLCCEHEQISAVKFRVIHWDQCLEMECENCGQVFFHAVEAKPTAVTGAGRGQVADEGLARLIAASADSPYDLVPGPNGWAWN